MASDKPSTLLVIDDAAKLDAGMREGLAVATFTFEPFTVDGIGSAGQTAAHENVRDLVYNRMKTFMDKVPTGSARERHPR